MSRDPSGWHGHAVPEAAVGGTRAWTALGHREVTKIGIPSSRYTPYLQGEHEGGGGASCTAIGTVNVRAFVHACVLDCVTACMRDCATA